MICESSRHSISWIGQSHDGITDGLPPLAEEEFVCSLSHTDKYIEIMVKLLFPTVAVFDIDGLRNVTVSGFGFVSSYPYFIYRSVGIQIFLRRNVSNPV